MDKSFCCTSQPDQWKAPWAAPTSRRLSGPPLLSPVSPPIPHRLEVLPGHSHRLVCHVCGFISRTLNFYQIVTPPFLLRFLQLTLRVCSEPVSYDQEVLATSPIHTLFLSFKAALRWRRTIDHLMPLAVIAP